MPAQQGTSILAKALGAKAKDLGKGVAKAREAPINFGMTRLPPGLDCVCKLQDIGFKLYGADAKDKTKVGKPYFHATGVIVSPRTAVVNGQELLIEGKLTRIMPIDCFDSTKDGKVTTAYDKFFGDRGVCNEMKKLQPDCLENIGEDVTALEDVCAAMVAADPPIHFNLTTSKRAARPYLDPKTKQMVQGEEGVWENWNGAVEFSSNGQASHVEETVEEVPVDEVGDGGGEAAEEVVEEPAADEVPEEPQDEPAVEGMPTDVEALTALAAICDEAGAAQKAGKKMTKQKADDAAAAELQLREAATAAGISVEDFDGAESFALVVDYIVAAGQQVEEAATEETPAEPEPEPEPFKPVVKGVYGYQLLDKSGKPVKGKDGKPLKPLQCTVTRVDAKKESADLVGPDKKTKYLGVAWDRLIVS